MSNPLVSLLSTLGHLLAGLGIAAGLLWGFQGRLLFYPTSELIATPRDWGLAYTDVDLVSSDGVRLHGWFIPGPAADQAPATDPAPDQTAAQTPRRTLLFLHGNAGNISHRRDSLLIFHRLGLDVLIIGYRGYGRSTGHPSEDGLYADADAAWRWLVDTHGVDPAAIVIFGRSLGAAVAAQLAATRPAGEAPAALIAESGFADLGSLARTLFPGVAHVLPLHYRFDAADWISQVQSPVLVLHSADDEIIPYNQGRALFEAAPEPRQFVVLRGDHNHGFLHSQPAYERALARFLAGLPPAERPVETTH
ncbi:MAG: alpha/beta hydrolase [Chromatiaceae bacterium]|nr:MAG: alpha/beta hydrolase [Chromatiaceae bacterium]